jgi:hypothetical protein
MTVGVARKRQRILAGGLHLIALALLGLQAYVRRLPLTTTAIPEPDTAEAYWWGLWPVTYLPGPVFTLGAVAIVGLIAYLWWREFSAPPTLQPPSENQTQDQRRTWYVLVAVSGLLLFAFFAFPIVHTRWGDAYILSRAIAWPDPELRLTRSWQAPLDVYLHSIVWLLVEPYVSWKDAAPVYRLLSPIAGAIYLFALLMLSRNRRFAPGWLTFGLVATLGLIQLFFGYIENYSFAAAAVLVYLWLGIGFAQSSRALWPAATALALANGLHPSTIVLVPSLLFLAWIGVRDPTSNGNKHLRNIVIKIALPMALVFVLTLFIMEMGNHGLIALFTSDRPGGGDGRWFVPLREVTTEWERYTMFSWAHLRDFINAQLLIAPVALPSLLLLAFARLARYGNKTSRAGQSSMHAPPYSTSEPSVARYLGIAFAFYVVFTWVWNPDYGGQRDWDLFSLVAIPEALLLVYALSHMLSPWRYLAMGAAPLIAVQTLHTSSWIYQNTLPWSWP